MAKPVSGFATKFVAKRENLILAGFRGWLKKDPHIFPWASNGELFGSVLALIIAAELFAILIATW